MTHSETTTPAGQWRTQTRHGLCKLIDPEGLELLSTHYANEAQLERMAHALNAADVLAGAVRETGKAAGPSAEKAAAQYFTMTSQSGGA